MKTKILFIAYFLSLSVTKAQMITTIAGKGISENENNGDGGKAIEANFTPSGVATDAEGNIYIIDWEKNCIRKINKNGIINTVVGNGQWGYGGDGGEAIKAELEGFGGMVIDLHGNIYIADINNQRIRKVNSLGIITTVAGNGELGFSGDGGEATNATLNYPERVVVDSEGNLYFSDIDNNRIRKISTSGIITTVVGNGNAGFSGDGGQATAAELNRPLGLAIDSKNNLYISDLSNNRIRKVNNLGIISTVAGNGLFGFSGDDGQATSAQLSFAYNIAVDSHGNLYISDNKNERVRMVDHTGIIRTIVGNGVGGFSGDGAEASDAQINNPGEIAITLNGSLLIADRDNGRIRMVEGLASENLKINNEQNKVAIYPNPSDGNMTIECLNNTIQEIKIFDMMGQLIYETKPSNGSIKISLQNSGSYFINAFIADEVNIKKVIVNK